MKKTEQFTMRINEDFLKSLDLICATKPGIKTRAAAVQYCVDVVMIGIAGNKSGEKEEQNK